MPTRGLPKATRGMEYSAYWQRRLLAAIFAGPVRCQSGGRLKMKLENVTKSIDYGGEDGIRTHDTALDRITV